MVVPPSRTLKEKMTTPVIEISNHTAEPVQTQPHSRQNDSLNGVGDKRDDVLRAKKKQKRDAHRVALRRSHTKG